MCLKLTAHKQEFFSFLRARGPTLFNARFDILLDQHRDPPFEGCYSAIALPWWCGSLMR